MDDETRNEGRDDGAKPRSRTRRLVRLLVRLVIWVVGFFVFAFGGAWFWFESSSSDEVLAGKAEAFLEEGLARDLTIGDLSLRPGLPAKIVVKGARLANVEGAAREDQASLTRIELNLSLRSLLKGKVRISDVVLVDPVFVLEVFPDGDGIRTNMPKWHGPKSESEEKPDVGIDSVEIRNGTFELVDHRNDVGVVARRIQADVEPDLRNLDDPRGRAAISIGDIRFRAGEFALPTFHVESEIRYEDQVLLVERFHGEGRAVRIEATGPIRRDSLDLDATLDAKLAELRDSLGLDVALEGVIDAKGGISGSYGDLSIEGTFESPAARFDVYEVADVRGSFRAIEKGFEVLADHGSIAGGTVSARYVASRREGEPKNVLEIRHEDVLLERVLSIWGIERAGFLARGSGALRLAWDDGNPAEGMSGSATIVPDAAATTRASYGTTASGRVDYRLADGSLHLEPLLVDTGETSISVGGVVGLERETLDLNAKIQSTSFAEVDRLWANLARAFGDEAWEILEIQGSGTLDASVAGRMDAPMVGIEVHADGFSFGSLMLERADGRIRFDGVRQDLWFDDARFERGAGELVVRERVGLRGEEPELALTVELHDWDVEQLLQFLELDMPVKGLASGTVSVEGVPTAARATFDPLVILDDEATLRLSGDASWTPEEKGLAFDLDVGLVEVPFETVAGVLDLGSDLPLSGSTSGTVRLEGPLTGVTGAGSVALDRGILLGEPFERIATELVINEGVVRLSNLDIRMPAGFVKGNAKYDFAQDRFGYVIEASELDIEKLRGYPTLKQALTGKLILLSSGAGSLEAPEIVLDARVKDAIFLEVPVAEPGVSLYATLRNGEFALRGGVGEVLVIGGAGRLDLESTAVEGRITAEVASLKSVAKRFEKRTGIAVDGSATLSLDLAGYVSPVEELVADGRIERVDLTLAGHTVKSAEPARFAMRDGRVSIDSFGLLVGDQTFHASGSLSVSTGAIDLDADGFIEAGLLALAMPDLRASGDIAVSLAVGGTLNDPTVDGTAEIRGADFRIQGFPQAFRDVRSTLVLSGDVIEIDSFTTKLGGGTVSAGGRIEMKEGSPSSVRINMIGRNVDLRLSPGLTIAGAFDLQLAGNPSERMFLRGTSSLDSILYTKDIEIGAAIVEFIVSRRATVDTVVEEWESRLQLNVEVAARDAIRVRNNLARITGSAGVTITGTLANPVLLGSAQLDEGGLLRINNVDYRIVNGGIQFQNPFRIDPFLDLTAEGRYQNEYDVTIAVSGTPDALQMSVSSDPPIADLSILNVFGIQTATTSGSVSTRDSVESASSSIIDSSVGTLLGSRLTFADNLRLEGLTGSEPKVTVEKSISDELRAIVTYTMNDAGDNVEVIEWRASPRFSIQLTRDSTKDDTYFINAIDVSFSRRFGGQW